jgi:hypothetical protein
VTRVEAASLVALEPRRALALWTDHRRWPSFVEGFHHVEREDGWPDVGAKLVWRSIPGGRGTVTERVIEHDPAGLIVTRIFEDALVGTQTVEFRDPPGLLGAAGADGGEGRGAASGSVARISLGYELPDPTLIRRLTDALFIRRAQRDALARALRRFAVEAEEDDALARAAM